MRRFVRRSRWVITLALSLGQLATRRAPAQGTTTATISGVVRSTDGHTDGARARVTNRSTGYAVESEVRRGRFFVSGLETGGPYSVEVRRIGFASQRRDGIHLRLGEQLEMEFVLQSQAVSLDTLRVTATNQAALSRFGEAGGGIATTIGESVLRDMPALNRDLLDFARLAPQVGTRFGGISGGGVSYRFNNYLIDGGAERLLNGNGMLSGNAGGRPISVEAVKEYQVLLAPFDPRYGDFAGSLVSAVTRGGTNELHTSAFMYVRNDGLARNTSFLRDAPYDRSQAGFSVGGPIRKDKAHFFVASEFQRFDQPSTGPFVGQDANASDALPASIADIRRFEDLLVGYGLEPGSGARVQRPNPTSNVFARVDFALPLTQSRVVLRHNAADAWQAIFARPTGTARFALTSNQYTQRVRRWSTAVQVFSQSERGWTNELLLNRSRSPSRATSYALSPLIEVSVPGSSGLGSAMLVAGSPDNAQGTGSEQKTFEMADHVAYHRGRHTFVAGTRAEIFAFNNISTRGQFGRWTFSSLDSLEQGLAARFRVEKDFGSATAVLRGTQVGFYAGDSWRATPRLTLNGGLRADVLSLDGQPSYNAAIDTLFQRRTDEFPGTAVHWAPRVGFVLDLGTEYLSRVRGGAGVFAGRPPLAWMSQALRFDGVGTLSLDCSGDGAPAFVADPANMPQTCANGRGFADGLVNLIDSRLRMAEMFRASLAYDRVLPWNVSATVEALYTRTLSDFVFEHPNLKAPQGTDSHGRVMYGTIAANGTARPSTVSDRFIELIALRNHGNGHALSVTGEVEKRFGERFETSASYTRSRVRDVQSVTTAAPVLTYAFWANGRVMAGRHDDLTPGISAYEIPHRVLVAGAWKSPAHRWSTTISAYYLGEAGVPFTYTDSTIGGSRGRGDLNADGTNSNDPIYVPRSALDSTEITFDGPADSVSLQREAFESFIARTPCLERHRGKILTRNACAGPWIHTANVAVRQQLPMRWSAGHVVSLDVEIFNVLNLVNPRWGLVRVPNTVALEHRRQVVTTTSSEPVFRFDATRPPFSADNAESAYQIQLALRYRF